MPAPIAATSHNAAHATWAAHYSSPTGYRHMPAEELVRFCGRRGDTLGRVLEVGCGNGANLWYLADMCTRGTAIGIDFCYQALSAVRSGLAVAQADAFHLPFAANSFDTIIDAMVSQHVSWADHTDVFTEYRRVLRRGGTAFIYHLVRGTTGSDETAVDYQHGIALFPAAGQVCLPDPALLTWRLTQSGFTLHARRGLHRDYPDGERASYAVIEGTAT